jgi:Uma2 family endonuclease
VNQKIEVYLDSGVREMWVIDPVSRDLAIHRAGLASQLLSERDEVEGGVILPGFRCSVAGFFHSLAVET